MYIAEERKEMVENPTLAALSSQFFMAQERLSINADTNISLLDVKRETHSKYERVKIFTILQEHCVHLLVLFLKHNDHFSMYSLETQETLVMSNIVEMSILSVAMFFNRKRNVLSCGWILSHGETEGEDVELSLLEFVGLVGEDIATRISKVFSGISALNLPPEANFFLILVAALSRDGLFIEDQVKVDRDRVWYLQALFKYLQANNKGNREESSKQLAQVHRVLKMTKDCAEDIKNTIVEFVELG